MIVYHGIRTKKNEKKTQFNIKILIKCQGIYLGLSGVPVDLDPVVDFVVDLPVGRALKGQSLSAPEPEPGDVEVAGHASNAHRSKGLDCPVRTIFGKIVLLDVRRFFIWKVATS